MGINISGSRVINAARKAAVLSGIKPNPVKVPPLPKGDSRPRAIVQVSPAVKSNGVFVNYGDQLMHWVLVGILEEKGFSVIRVPRLDIDSRSLKKTKAALFVDCPGYVYSGTHHSGMRSADAALTTARNATSSKRGGAFVMAAPQTYGPFSSEEGSALNRQMQKWLRTMDLVYARDDISIAYLETFGLPTSGLIRKLPDLAFLYRSNKALGTERLRKLGLDVEDHDRPIVGVIASRQVHSRLNDYMSITQNIISWLLKQGAQPIIIPHEYGRFGPDEEDDQWLSLQMARLNNLPCLALNKSDGVLSENDELDYIRSIEDVIGSLDFLVSGRFHGALRGLAECVPTAVLSWSHKYDGLYEDVGLPATEHTLTGSMSAEGDSGVIDRLQRAWLRRHETRTHLESVIPDVKYTVESEIGTILERVLAGLPQKGRARAHHD